MAKSREVWLLNVTLERVRTFLHQSWLRMAKSIEARLTMHQSWLRLAKSWVVKFLEVNIIRDWVGTPLHQGWLRLDVSIQWLSRSISDMLKFLCGVFQPIWWWCKVIPLKVWMNKLTEVTITATSPVARTVTVVHGVTIF